LEPNFFIVGGSKCGTTNISYYLDLHHDVFISKLNEPYYFCKWDISDDFVRESMIIDKKKYLRLFESAKTQKAIGEATPSYLHSPNSARKIKERFPESKIIISVRNPIERAYSGYLSNELRKNDGHTFREMIDRHKKLIENNEFFIYNILEPGFYSKHIKRFQNIFDREKIKIIIFEEYITNIEGTIKSILDFLELDHDIDFTEQPKRGYRKPKNKFGRIIFENDFVRRTATSLIPTVTRQKIGERFLLEETKKPPMCDDDRHFLKNFYQNDVQELASLLDKKLPWNDFS
tara:strand:- start:1339 stop:2208 length:870 start_codon:yes stop_codon:yes gene_type:complete